MSEENPIDAVEPGVTGEDAREIAAALCRSGQISVADANKVLAGKGAVPLAEGSMELAHAERSRLMANPEFTAKYLAGDPEAQAKLNGLDARIMRGGPEKVTDRDVAPASDFHFDTAARYNGELSPKAIMDMDGDATAWAQDLKLSPSLASTLVSLARDADNVQDREAFAREHEQFLARVMPDADARIAAAQKVLNEASSTRKVDLRALLKSAGAEAVVLLIHHADAIALSRKR